MELKQERTQVVERIIRNLISLVLFLLAAIVLFPLTYFFGGDLFRAVKNEFVLKFRKIEIVETQLKETFWSAPDLNTVDDTQQRAQIEYGRELIAHTAKYLGPKGIVMQITNGMNCQNCHLDAGTKTFGNNYSAVATTYPKFRARSGSMEDVYKRVNDCMERSLNGQPLDSMGREMQAIKAYILFLGSNVEPGSKANGSGLKDLAYLSRECDPVKGRLVYETKCMSCHQANGTGLAAPDGYEYLYPPLWGDHSYNDGAGLFRVSAFARYIKYNMPLGVTHINPQLTDEESWDVAAYVNSQPRPHKDVPLDWPDITKKPVDHPFGPYADTFTEKQHKYGPFMPILENLNRSTSTALK